MNIFTRRLLEWLMDITNTRTLNLLSEQHESIRERIVRVVDGHYERIVEKKAEVLT